MKTSYNVYMEADDGGEHFIGSFKTFEDAEDFIRNLETSGNFFIRKIYIKN